MKHLLTLLLLCVLAPLCLAAEAAEPAPGLYISENVVTEGDAQYWMNAGGHFVEFITGAAIGSPREHPSVEAINYEFSAEEFRARMMRIRPRTSLLVLDCLEGAIQQELKINRRDERHIAAIFMQRVMSELRRYTQMPAVWDGMPGGAPRWPAEILEAVNRHTGLDQFSVNAYWQRGTLEEFLADLDMVHARALGGQTGVDAFSKPRVLQTSIDVTSQLDTAEEFVAVFDWCDAKGIDTVILWRNPGAASLPRTTLDMLLAAWEGPGIPPPDPGDDEIGAGVPEEFRGYWEQSARARANGIGVNLGPNDPWDTTWPWSNLLHQAQFRDAQYGYTDPEDITDGELLMMIGHECGQQWPGSPGRWEFDADGGAAPKDALPSTKTNEGIQFRIGPDARGFGDGVSLTALDWPSSGGGFHDVFLERLAPVAGYIRFMDWQETNNSSKRNWSDEPTADAFYSEHGIPISRMIDLCNTVGAYPWLCIPHLATDEYVHAFCAFVRERLHPDLRVIVELSNECWNQGMFEQARHFGTAAAYANRAREVMTIVQAELPDSFRVIGTQENNLGITDQVLNSGGGDCSMFTHLGVGFYIGYWMDESPSTPQSAEAILTHTRGDIARLVANLEQHKAKAESKGLKLCGYEGGLHLVGVGQYVDEYFPRFQAANRHAMAGDVEQELRVRTLSPALMDFALQYTFAGRDSKWGMWGVLPYVGADPEEHERYMTLVEDAQKNPN